MSLPTEYLGARILIVDDQETNVRLLTFALSRAGYLSVTSTLDPLQVCALHAENRYDLILLDLQMPDMSGFEVMEALRCIETDHHVAVLVLSADPSQMVRVLEAGATGFLSKPFVLGDVIQRIHRILETASSLRAEERERPLPSSGPVADPVPGAAAPGIRFRDT